MRQSRAIIEEAYRKVYNIPAMKELDTKDDNIINKALMKVRLYDGRYDGEENIDDDTLVDKREQDKNAVSGDPSSMIRHLKSIGAIEQGLSDWEAVFTLYYRYIDPVGKKEYAKMKERMSKAAADEATKQSAEDTSKAREEKVETVEEAPVKPEVRAEEVEQSSVHQTQEVQSDSSYINNTTLKEEVNMSSPTIKDLMNQEGSVDAAIQNANAMVGNVAGSTMALNSSNVSTGEVVLTEEDKALAKEAAEGQKARRTAWNNEHKISCFVLANYPLSKRVVAGVTTGKIKNAEKVLESTLKAVWEAENRPADMDSEGKVDGVVQIPKCVQNCGQSEQYTLFITTLCEAKNGGNKEIKVNLNTKPSNFKGVIVKAANGESSWTMAEAKKEINANGMSKLQVEGIASGVQLQIKVMSRDNISKKKAKMGDGKISLEDITQLQIPGRDSIIDMKTGDILDPTHVKVYNELNMDVSKAAEDDKVPAYSDISFKYLKAVKASDGESTTKKMTRRIPLTVKTYKVDASTVPAMQPFAPRQGVGVPINPLSPEEEQKSLETMYQMSFTFAIETNDADLNAKRAESKNQRSQAEAEAAAQNIAGDQM